MKCAYCVYEYDGLPRPLNKYSSTGYLEKISDAVATVRGTSVCVFHLIDAVKYLIDVQV